MRTCQEILDSFKHQKYQVAGYFNQPYNFNQQFNYIPQYVIPELTNIYKDTKLDFLDNKKSGEQINKEQKDKFVNLGVGTGVGLLNTFANTNYYNNQLNRQQDLINQNNNYVNIPYDNRYNSAVQDKTQAYQTGGLLKTSGLLKSSVSQLGYKDYSPYKENPFLDIQSPSITMKDVSQPLIGQSDTGEIKMMYPNQDYQFNGNKVREYKLYESGGKADDDDSDNDNDIYGQYDYSNFENNNVTTQKEDDYWEDDELPFSVSPEVQARLNEIKKSQVNVKDSYNLSYDNKYPNENTSFKNVNIPQNNNNIFPVVQRLKQMGLNASSVNTGLHNVRSKHYQNKAVDLGLNTTFGGDKVKMQQFQQWFNEKGYKQFPGLKLHDERARPRNQAVWGGSHYHLEY